MKPLYATWIIIFAGILLITAGLGLGGSIAAKTEEMNGPVSMNKVVVSSKSQPGTSNPAAFTLDEIRTIEEQLDTYAACTAVPGHTINSVQTDSASYSVSITGTNWRYPEFNALTFLYGGYFNQKAEDEGAAYAVIDDTLAWNLFKTEDAVGRTVMLYGVPFKITGVFKAGESVGEFLTDTGLPQVYIPVGKMLELDTSARITALQVKTDDGGASNKTNDSGASDKNAANVENALMQAGLSPTNYNISDYNIKAAQLRQKPMLLVFLAGIAAMLVLAGFLIKTMADMVRLIKEGLKEDYFVKVVKSNSRILAFLAIKILLLLGSIAALWLLSSFRLYIPPEYIPDDLTNLQYFVSLIKADIRSEMAGLGMIPSRTELIAGTMESLSNWIFYISLFAGSILTYLGFVLLKTFNQDRIRTTIYCGSFLLVSAILAAIAAISLGMPPFVDMRGIAVFWILIFITLNKDMIQKNERNVKQNV